VRISFGGAGIRYQMNPKPRGKRHIRQRRPLAECYPKDSSAVVFELGGIDRCPNCRGPAEQDARAWAEKTNEQEIRK